MAGALRRAGFGALCALTVAGAAIGAPAPARLLSPAERFGPLYAEVETRHIFADSKTFADAVPKRPDAAILADYDSRARWSAADLAAFVAQNFSLPPDAAPAMPPPAPDIEDHIRALWPVLTRTAATVPPDGSALALPKPYVVPGGRFRELYYWDSYFTMLGLARSGRQDLVDDMIEDFGSLIDRYGRIPNGTRTYYLSRSQPPFFYLMVGLSKRRDAATLKRRNDWLRAEHRFWMAGDTVLRPGQDRARVVRLRNGDLLNRYWDDRADPRDESYREDVATAATAPSRPASEVYRNIRAAAESGWDFSSRWLGDGRSLATIRTTDVAPVDLNSLLYGLETAIADNCRTLADRACTSEYIRRATARRRAIRRDFWNAEGGFFADYDWRGGSVAKARTAAMFFPLFVRAATTGQAGQQAASARGLMSPGGVATTQVRTGQQWDAPNGWAPLQWIAVAGLRHYGQRALANRIASAWLGAVCREYRASGRLLEKYDVVRAAPGGGGEYPLQDGFGWTNGVVLELLGGRPSDGCGHPQAAGLD